MKKLFTLIFIAVVMFCTAITANAASYKVDFSETTGGEMPDGWLNLEEGSVWITGSGYLYFYFPKSETVPVITPKFTIKSGDTFTVYAAPSATNYASSTSKVKVYVSTDRTNWTPVGEIKPNGNAAPGDMKWDTNAGITPTKFVFSGFPTGDYYIGFFAEGVNMKSVEGFTLAQVDNDAFINGFTVPKSAVVNHALSTSVSVKNMINKESKCDAILYADDEPVKVVSDVTLGAYETKAIDITYVPHTAGNVELKAELKFSESYNIASAVATVPCKPETAELESHVGEYGDKCATSQVIILSSKANSYTESIWYASEIKVPKNKQITQIVFPHWSNTSSDFTATMRVFLQNTSDELVGETPADKEKMTKVYEGVRTYVKCGSSTEFEDFVIELDAPFEYTGGNLRIAVENVNSSATYRNVYFNYYNSTAGRTGTKYSSSEAGLATANFSHNSTYVPCGSLYYAIDAPVVTANVVDQSGTPVAGATVTLYNEEKDVLYTATSNASGVATINVYQALNYALSVEADNYKPYESTVMVASSNVNIPVALESESTGVKTVDATHASHIVHKVVINGAVFVEKDGKHYNMQGSRVK